MKRRELFVKQLPNQYICGVCDDIFDNCMQTECNHYYCQECLDKTLKTTGGFCLYDRSIIDKNECKRNIQVNQVIEKQEMKCGNENCQWTGNFFEYKLKHKNTCEFEKVNCENDRNGCFQKIPKNKIEEHQQVCEFRKISCGFCKKNEITFNEMKNHHDFYCEGNTIECPNKCENLVIFKNVKTHLTEECPLESIDCPMGCKEKIKRKDTKQHYESSLNQHFLLAISQIENLKKNHQNELSDMEIKFNNLKEFVKSDNERVIHSLQVHMEHSSKNILETEKQIEGLKNEDKFLQNEMFKLGKGLRWKINKNLVQKSSFKKSISSPPFIVHGIRWYCQLFPKGQNKEGNFDIFLLTVDQPKKDTFFEVMYKFSLKNFKNSQSLSLQSEEFRNTFHSQQYGYGTYLGSFDEILKEESFIFDDFYEIQIQILKVEMLVYSK